MEHMRKPEEVQIGEYTLKEILKRHELWLVTNKSSFQAILQNVDLSYVDLSHVNLRYAILCNVNLENANLCSIDLTFTTIKNSDFTYADLDHARLDKAQIYNCTFYRATFDSAQLYQTYFDNTILCRTEFCRANLSRATLNNTNIDEAYLEACILYNTHIDNATGSLLEYRRGKILTESIIGYKKCQNNVIVTLEIPKDAIVFSINGDKCRTNKAKVIAIDGADRAFSKFCRMTYYVGDEFNIKDFNCEYNRECANGIHFFMTREEAEAYQFF